MSDKFIKLGKYTLTEQLGSGGFGTVYKATDPSGRTVAVKVLKPGWSDDPATIERFRREAQVAGELFHSRIATIIDFDEVDGRLFLVMRYIDGIPLDKLIQQKGRIEWAQAIQILEQVAEGLDYAHQRGLVHRDIKPANILVSEKDGAVLTDFGLVKAADVSGMSTSGVMLGTPHYIAPEIWHGKPATPQTDLYSLACVAYEMLTGQVLFSGNTPPEIMNKHLQPTPPLPAKSPPGLPAGMRNVIAQALQGDLSKRYANVQAFLADLKKQEASLRQGAAIQAQGMAREAELHIQRNELPLAQAKLAQLAELAPDSALIASLEQKIESMSRLNGIYDEVFEQVQAAKEKARTILAENPAYPDARGLFPKLGLRAGKTWLAPVPMARLDNAELRWYEKALPYFFLVAGLGVGVLGQAVWMFSPAWNINLTGPFRALAIVIGLFGIASGLGMLLQKPWAHRAGLIFTSLLEILGILLPLFRLSEPLAYSLGWPIYLYASANNRYPETVYIFLLLLPLSIFLGQVLSSPRLAGSRPYGRLPQGINAIALAFGMTGLGLLPAFLLLTRRTARTRRIAQLYALLLGGAVAIVLIITAIRIIPAAFFGNIFLGIDAPFTVASFLFFVGSLIAAFRYLRSPKIVAYYENREP